jgi:hypothetical protein
MTTSNARFIAGLLLGVSSAALASHAQARIPGVGAVAGPRSTVAAVAFDPGQLAPSLSRLNGHYVGNGPNYVCRFDGASTLFNPVLGDEGSPAAYLRLELSEVRRGADVLWSLADASRSSSVWRPASAASVHGPSLERRIADGWVERADLHPSGVELSLSLQSEPYGSGDLTLRYTYESGLGAPIVQATGELNFGAASGIRVESVWGIDSTGRRWTGSTSADDTALEFSLSAECLSHATYPLVLDPLVTPSSDVMAEALTSDGSPDIAYREGVGYLAVWRRSVNLAQSDLLGQRLDVAGAPAGGVIAIVSQSDLVAQDPAVAGVAGSTRFLVAWTQAPDFFAPTDIFARTVNGADGAISTVVQLSTTPSDAERSPDVGGLVTPGGAWVAWARPGLDLSVRRVEVAGDGNPSLPSAATIVATGTQIARPAISKGTDATGRAVVAWEAAVSGSRDIFGAVVDGAGVVVSAQNLTNDPTRDDSAPDVDGAGLPADGTGSAFMLAWESSLGGAPSKIRCAIAEVDGVPLALTLSTAADIGSVSAFADHAPAVGYAGSKHLVAWSRETGGFNSELHLIGLNNTDCDVCDLESTIAGSSLNANVDRVEVACARAGGSASDDRGIAIRGAVSTLLPFDADVKATVWEAFGPGVTNQLGFGTCGLPAGNLSFLQPAALGNDTFSVTMPVALPTPLLYLLLLTFEDSNNPVLTAPGCPAGCDFHFNGPLSLLIVPTGLTPPTYVLPIPCDQNLAGQRLFFRGLYISAVDKATPCEFADVRLDATREVIVELAP